MFKDVCNLRRTPAATENGRRFRQPRDRAVSEYDLPSVLAFKPEFRQLLLPRFIRRLLRFVLLLLHFENLFVRHLLERFGYVVIFVKILLESCQLGDILPSVEVQLTISPSSRTFSPRTRNSPRSISP